jgi:hypothetical protein
VEPVDVLDGMGYQCQDGIVVAQEDHVACRRIRLHNDLQSRAQGEYGVVVLDVGG